MSGKEPGFWERIGGLDPNEYKYLFPSYLSDYMEKLENNERAYYSPPLDYVPPEDRE